MRISICICVASVGIYIYICFGVDVCLCMCESKWGSVRLYIYVYDDTRRCVSVYKYVYFVNRLTYSNDICEWLYMFEVLDISLEVLWKVFIPFVDPQISITIILL